ncbi:hypothetical protein J4Q44_G00373450 [Coregonus suidteri]|uniref:Uncharacterized protein n=1 Tax=Coregonus suidteri TaxID=861788 RepID=A0AAN8Q6C8_9TELE
MSCHYDFGYESESDSQSSKEEPDSVLDCDYGHVSGCDSDDQSEESREVGLTLFIEPTPSQPSSPGLSGQCQCCALTRNKTVTQAEVEQAEVEQAVTTLLEVIEAMVGEHHEKSQSSSLEIPRGPDCALAPVVVSPWITWFRSMDSATVGTEPVSSQPENSPSKRGGSEEDTSMMPSISRKRATESDTSGCPGGFQPEGLLSKRKRRSEDTDSFLVPMMPPWVPCMRTRELNPSSCISWMKLKRSDDSRDSVTSVTRKRTRESASLSKKF